MDADRDARRRADGAPAAADAGSKFAFEGGGSKRAPLAQGGGRERVRGGGRRDAVGRAGGEDGGSERRARALRAAGVGPTLTDLGIPAMSDEEYAVFLRDYRAANGVDFESTIKKADSRARA